MIKRTHLTTLPISYTSKDGNINITQADVISLYENWDSPIVIISDGPYGINSFPGDLISPDLLPSWYEPHISEWTKKATSQTTLWFWNTEIGWAKIHPVLEKYGWKYIGCNIWDKGLAHIAGNANTKTLRKLPVVTEICVQYSKNSYFKINGKPATMKDWLRYEWKRTGLPFSLTNKAAGVKDAATRKYFTKCHLWYYPPPDAFTKIANYANEYGNVKGRPYFSIDGKKQISTDEWTKLRSKFHCPIGVTNVWHVPPLNGKERIKLGNQSVHLNQKPLELMKLIIEISSDQGDVIWDPFGGLMSGAIAAHQLKRKCFSSEINPDIFSFAINRIKNL